MNKIMLHTDSRLLLEDEKALLGDRIRCCCRPCPVCDNIRICDKYGVVFSGIELYCADVSYGSEFFKVRSDVPMSFVVQARNECFCIHEETIYDYPCVINYWDSACGGVSFPYGADCSIVVEVGFDADGIHCQYRIGDDLIFYGKLHTEPIDCRADPIVVENELVPHGHIRDGLYYSPLVLGHSGIATITCDEA